LAYAAGYSAEHREERRDYGNLYQTARRATDPAFKIAGNWRNRINKALAGLSKSAESEELLGCSWDQFLGHLEILFQAGMTWDNHGEWHVDHIKPLAAFDVSKPEEQRKACHWSNHQPLWAKDNLSKGAKWQAE
jgi:hypothetical protein